MSQYEPPTRHPLTEQDGVLTLPWLLFFNQTFSGDAGSEWSPEFVNLTTVGEPTITGRYYKLSQYLAFFNVLITPGTNSSATAGSTYIEKFPLEASSNGFCVTVSNRLGGGLGIVEASSNRIYVPAWTTVTTPLNVIGMVEAS